MFRYWLLRGGIFITFSQFVQIIQPRTTYSSNKSKFIVRLFKSIGSTRFIDDEDDYARRLYLGKSGNKTLSISEEIRDSIPNPFRIKKASEFFGKVIIFNRYYELFDAFGISSNYERNNETLVVALSLMFQEYCTKPEDKINTSVRELYFDNFLDNATVEHLDQYKMVQVLNNICPLCGKEPLVISKKDKPALINYELVKIYPDKQNLFLRETIEQYAPLIGDSNDEKNKILLGKKCSKKYLDDPQSSDFKKLIDKRRELDKKLRVIEIDNDNEIYDSINALLDILLNVKNADALTHLEFNALKVKAKIPENTDLYDDVIRRVLKYYPYIDSYLKTQEFKEIDRATNLCLRVKELSHSLVSSGYSKESVVETLVNRFAKLANAINPEHFKSAAFIIVSYFIQHCEVLTNETP